MPKRVPFEFVLDELAPRSPRVRAMFGAHAVYVGEKLVLILRERGEDDDDGVWLATSEEHHESLRRELPSLRSIGIFGGKITAWQNLPAGAASFEREALHGCALILRGDERIGKVPKARRRADGNPAGSEEAAGDRGRRADAQGRPVMPDAKLESPSMALSEAELELLRNSGGLSLDAHGNFFVHGEPVEHARSQLALTQGMHRAPDGRWATRIGREWGYVQVADVAFFIRRVEPVHDPVKPGLLRATLTSGEEQLIDVSTFSSGANDALYARLPDGEEARLSRPAQLSLMPWIQEDARGIALELDGARFAIGRRDQG